MNRVLGMLGLCARARKLITGEKAVIQAVRAGSACAVALDGAASENAVKAVSQACQTHGVPLIRTEPLALGDAIGKPGRMAAAVTDPGLAGGVLKAAGINNKANDPRKGGEVRRSDELS